LYRSNPNKNIKSRGKNIEKNSLKQLHLYNCDKVEHPGDLRKPNREEEKNNSSSQKLRVIIYSPAQVKPFFFFLAHLICFLLSLIFIQSVDIVSFSCSVFAATKITAWEH